MYVGSRVCVYVCAHMHTQMISKFGVLRLCLATPQKQHEAKSYEIFLNINKSENLRQDSTSDLALRSYVNLRCYSESASIPDRVPSVVNDYCIMNTIATINTTK